MNFEFLHFCNLCGSAENAQTMLQRHQHHRCLTASEALVTQLGPISGGAAAAVQSPLDRRRYCRQFEPLANAYAEAGSERGLVMMRW